MTHKKILAAIASVVMCFSFTIAASAATTSDVISKMQADGASATQVAQAKDFFKSNSGSFTSAQLDTISSGMDKAESIMKQYNVTDPTKLPASAKAEVKDIVTSTASAVGVTVSFGKNSSGAATLTLSKNGSTYTFGANDSAPKTTGSDSTLPVAVLSLGMLLAAGTATYMISSRRKASNN